MGLNLEGFDLRYISFEGRIIYTNPFEGARLADDDIAVAAMLEAMGAWVHRDGAAPYPLADACQDHMIGLAINESARTRRPVTVGTQPWAS